MRTCVRTCFSVCARWVPSEDVGGSSNQQSGLRGIEERERSGGGDAECLQ